MIGRNLAGSASAAAMTSDGPQSRPGETEEAALERLLADPALRMSDRQRKFLRYVASATLSGHGNSVKAYTIGVDVFGRGSDFDPMTDPIVRVEAARLRVALERYYLGPGRKEPLQVHLEKGRYLTCFVPVAFGPNETRWDTDTHDDDRSDGPVEDAATGDGTRKWLCFDLNIILLAGLYLVLLLVGFHSSGATHACPSAPSGVELPAVRHD